MRSRRQDPGDISQRGARGRGQALTSAFRPRVVLGSADEEPGRLLDPEPLLKLILAEGLDEVVVERGLQEFRRDAVLVFKAGRQVENGGRLQVQQLPGRQLAKWLRGALAVLDEEGRVGMGEKPERTLVGHGQLEG